MNDREENGPGFVEESDERGVREILRLFSGGDCTLVAEDSDLGRRRADEDESDLAGDVN